MNVFTEENLNHGMFIFVLLVLEAYTSGLAATLNAIFSGFEGQLSESEASSLVQIWHWISLLVFMLSWVIAWKSPAQRFAESEMDRWHRMHGDKMLPPELE